MNDVLEDVLAAQRDPTQHNALIAKYLPFIKGQLRGLRGMRLEYDDMLSLAMLTFSGCVRQYAEEKGNFLAFCSACIRNRLLDESRRQTRYESRVVPLFDEQGRPNPAEADVSLAAYDAEQERLALALEIEGFSAQLAAFQISFGELPLCCPKQTRSRRLCLRLAREVLSTPEFFRELMENHRLAQSALAARLSVSPKTIEKHRKYIVALALLQAGDYPYIQSFLPDAGEVV